MRELGRASARARAERRQPSGNESLREYLRREVPPERVWQALEAAMQGKNESARVAAVKVLAQELYEPELQDDQAARWRAEYEANAHDECPRCARIAAEIASQAEENRAKVAGLIERRVEQRVRQRLKELGRGRRGRARARASAGRPRSRASAGRPRSRAAPR
jgi:hypothetical protein